MVSKTYRMEPVLQERSALLAESADSPIPEAQLEEFRQAAHQVADWITGYLGHVRQHPVTTSVKPGDLASQLPKSAPEQGQSYDQIFRDFETTLFPALTLWNHPRFFAYFPNSATPPSILAEFLAAGLNVNAMLWKASPGATELETVTLTWLRQWLGLDEQWFGIIYDTASIGVMQAIGAARERMDPECRTRGMRPGLIVYTSEHTHNSAEKGAITLGFGQNNIRRIPVDDQFRMQPGELEEAILSDIAAGYRPCCIIASVGSTSTSAVEPIPEIAALAEKYGMWLHVDAAYGGSAAAVPEMRWVFDGVERADSLVLNPHKWMYVGLDCSVLYTRHPEVFRRASALSFEALKTAEDGAVVNYMDYGVQLGRRFRALKLWFVFRYYGREGVIAMLRESLRLAQLLKALIESSPDFEVAAPVPFSLVCFRHLAGNEFNRQLLAEINSTGSAYLSHTVLKDRFTLRLAIGNFMTAEEDIRETWRLIERTAHKLHSFHESAGD